MISIIVRIVLVASLLFGVASAVDIYPHKDFSQTPSTNFVFRSVVDDIPRALTLHVSEQFWMTFDTETCAWKKAWSGSMNFKREVYTGEKVVQPTSHGDYVFNFKKDTVAPFYIKKNQVWHRASFVVFKEYSYKSNSIEMTYEVYFGNERAATIKEYIYIHASADKVLWKRSYSITEEGAYPVAANVIISKLIHKKDLRLPKSFFFTKRHNVWDQGNQYMEIEGLLPISTQTAEVVQLLPAPTAPWYHAIL